MLAVSRVGALWRVAFQCFRGGMPPLTNAEIARQLAALDAVLRARPEGSTLPEVLDDYARHTGQPMNRRVLLHRLGHLRVEGRVRTVGRGGGAHYYPDDPPRLE